VKSEESDWAMAVGDGYSYGDGYGDGLNLKLETLNLKL